MEAHASIGVVSIDSAAYNTQWLQKHFGDLVEKSSWQADDDGKWPSVRPLPCSVSTTFHGITYLDSFSDGDFTIQMVLPSSLVASRIPHVEVWWRPAVHQPLRRKRRTYWEYGSNMDGHCFYAAIAMGLYSHPPCTRAIEMLRILVEQCYRGVF